MNQDKFHVFLPGGPHHCLLVAKGRTHDTTARHSPRRPTTVPQVRRPVAVQKGLLMLLLLLLMHLMLLLGGKQAV